MKKEEFDKLPVDHKFLVVHEYMELLKSATHNRMSLLPTMAALSAGLLVIVTFNKDIVNLSIDIKIITTALLLLIPLPLYLYNEDQKSLADKAILELDNLRGEKYYPDIGGTKGKITAWMPDIIIYSLSVLCLILVLKLWVAC